MQLSGSATTRGDVAARDQSATSAASGAKAAARTLANDILKKVKAGAAKLIDVEVAIPEKVTALTPEDTTSCIQYLIWSSAVHEKTTAGALAKLRTDDSTKRVIPDSLLNLSGSSQLSKRLFFRHINTDTQALMGLQDDGKGGVELVVSFRGSVSNEDWITDLLIDMDPVSTLVPSQTDPKLRVHAGFTESANDFLTDKTTLFYGPRDATEADRKAFEKLAKKEPLTDAEKVLVTELKTAKTLKELGDQLVQKSKKRLTKVIIVGHSLGGALATVTAYWCRKVGWPNLPVDYYSYGSPRVANRAFAAEWNKTMIETQPGAKVFRVMHHNDLVPAIPRADLPIPGISDTLQFDRYTHVEGGVLVLQPGQNPMIGPQGNPKQWPKLAVDPVNGWQAQLRRRPINLGQNTFDDHHIVDYLAHLKSARENYSP